MLNSVFSQNFYENKGSRKIKENKGAQVGLIMEGIRRVCMSEEAFYSGRLINNVRTVEKITSTLKRGWSGHKACDASAVSELGVVGGWVEGWAEEWVALMLK